MTEARALTGRMFGILDNGRYDEFTTVVTEDVVKVELCSWGRSPAPPPA